MEKGKLGEKVEEIFKNSKLQKVLGAADEEDDHVNHQEEVCVFCERNRPIFLVDSDDMILRMQERFLPQFLKNLKQDFLANKQYLKYLKINSKLIHVCNCDWKKIHAYCITAHVLRTKKIYCKDCYCHFYLYVRSQRLLTTEMVGDMTKYILIFMAFCGFIYGVYYFDNLLKTKHVDRNWNDPDYVANLTTQERDGLEHSHIYGVDSTFVMVPLIVVLTLIIIWFFYLRFVISFI
jgi:hypothetical protein